MYRNNKKYEDITRISKVSLWPTHASRKIFGTSVKYLKCPELIKLLKAISSYYSVTCIAVITKSTEPTTSIDVQSHSDFSSVRNYLHRGPVSQRFFLCEELSLQRSSFTEIFPSWETTSVEVLSHRDFSSTRTYLPGDSILKAVNTFYKDSKHGNVTKSNGYSTCTLHMCCEWGHVLISLISLLALCIRNMSMKVWINSRDGCRNRGSRQNIWPFS